MGITILRSPGIITPPIVTIATGSPLPVATQNAAYSTQLVAVGGAPPYAWLPLSGIGNNTWNLPSSGLLNGTPTHAETDVIGVMVTDSKGNTAVGTFSILVQPASGFFADPFSAAATRLVDPVNGINQAGGTPLTQTWNGVTAVYQCYKDVWYATNDFLTTAGPSGRRIGLLAATTYVLTQDVLYPGSGTNDATRIALQGDPAALAIGLPKIDCNLKYGIKPGLNVSNDWLTMRKFEVTNQHKIGTDGNANPGAIEAINSHSTDGFVAEYLYIHDCSADTGTSDIGGISVKAAGPTQGPIVRFCKTFNIFLSTGGPNNNFTGVFVTLSPTAIQAQQAQVLNCLLDGNAVGNGVYHKFNNTVSSTSSTISRCIIRNYYSGIEFGQAGGAAGQWQNLQVDHNLFYSPGVANAAAIYGGPSPTVGQQWANMKVFNNTHYAPASGPNNVFFAMTGITGIDIRNNVTLATYFAIRFDHNPAPGGILTRVSYCDSNVYLTGSQNWRVQSDTGVSDNFATLPLWRTAFSVGGASPILSADPDQIFSTLYPATIFTNPAAQDFSPSVGSVLLGSGTDGKNIGCYDGPSIAASTLIGPGW